MADDEMWGRVLRHRINKRIGSHLRMNIWMVVSLLLIAGCAHQPMSHSPLPESVQQQLGRIAVVVTSTADAKSVGAPGAGRLANLGQIQPYAGIGPSFFIANGSIASLGTGIDAVNQTRTDFGFDVRVGAAWQLGKRLAVFSEYRFTDVNLRFLDRQCLASSCAPTQTTIINETKVSLATHHILV